MPKSKKEQELENKIEAKIKSKVSKWDRSGGKSGGHCSLYFVGSIGALVYWLQAADGFGAVVTSFLKALVWPAMIIYKLLEDFYGLV